MQGEGKNRETSWGAVELANVYGRAAREREREYN